MPPQLIDSSGPAFSFGLVSEDTAQPPSHIAIDGFKDVGRTMLEVLEPPFQCAIQIRTDGFHTSSIIASGLTPYGVFEFTQALLA
ncbi:MAG: hypothetical protein WCD39_16035, partial [Methyloceanibacter sp.]